MSAHQHQFSASTNAVNAFVAGLQWQDTSAGLIEELRRNSFLNCTTPDLAANMLINRLAAATKNTIVTDTQFMQFVEAFAHQAGVHNEALSFRAVPNPEHISVASKPGTIPQAGAQSIFENSTAWREAIGIVMHLIDQKYHHQPPRHAPSPA